jgi:hypothetical protein
MQRPVIIAAKEFDNPVVDTATCFPEYFPKKPRFCQRFFRHMKYPFWSGNREYHHLLRPESGSLKGLPFESIFLDENYVFIVG